MCNNNNTLLWVASVTDLRANTKIKKYSVYSKLNYQMIQNRKL